MVHTIGCTSVLSLCNVHRVISSCARFTYENSHYFGRGLLCTYSRAYLSPLSPPSLPLSFSLPLSLSLPPSLSLFLSVYISLSLSLCIAR